ncbi:MAG: aquaporin Z [Gemmataceae bacterium]|nr:aquaporin Z [Gemmataceae bacterium]
MSIVKCFLAEFIGTFWLVFGGCGSAVLAAQFATGPSTHPVQLGIGFLGVAFAFGLTVLTMAYAVGHISGGHFNPAVTIGLVFGRRANPAVLVPYVAAQVLGGIAGAAALFVIASGKTPSFEVGGFACNGFDEHSPGGYSMISAFVAEFILTAAFLIIIMGATDKRAPAGFAPIAIGLGLTLIHLIGIPVTNLSVNPARSTGPAMFVRDWAFMQLWLFWLAPICGGITGAILYQLMAPAEEA